MTSLHLPSRARARALISRLGAGALLCGAVAIAGCGQSAGKDSLDLSLRQKIAQKLMLDIRYYCPDQRRVATEAVDNHQCNQPVTVLPSELRAMIRESDIGGIILFADNLQNSAQMVRLNRDLQRAAADSASTLPLLIGIDQEGGRVNRLPRDEAAAFAGNMAIGATYPKRGDHFATLTASVMAEQLQVLGFNVNFAPTLDVNSNPDNPVINVRSYGESPKMVADLGAASVAAFQQAGIAATVKHFPGHGDTSVDSHTGLPRVERSLQDAQSIDLLPFAEVIARAQPALTMTAHIQYPSLDDTILHSKSGEEMLAPATLSRKILRGILREQMAYRGVIVTDSLHMAGISDYFAPKDAVIKTFAAGADIALMPIKIRYPDDIPQLQALIDEVAGAVEAGVLSMEELDESLARVLSLKQQFVDATWAQKGEVLAVREAQAALASEEHRAVAEQLANAALTAVFTPKQSALPVIDEVVSRIQVLAPSRAIGEAFRISLAALTDVQVEVLDPETAPATVAQAPADVLVVASIVPGESAVDLGGMEDLPGLRSRRLDLAALYQSYRKSLQAARASGSKTVFVSMRSPYESTQFHDLADVHFASFDYKAFIGPGQKLEGPIYHALARALTSNVAPEGQLPVTVAEIPESVSIQASKAQPDSEKAIHEG